MWAAPAGMFSFARAGAAMVAVMIYAGIEGRPMPRIIQVIMVNTSVKRMLVLPREIIVLAMVRPNPVLEHTPMMMPTQAQATATDTVCLAPSASASSRSLKDIRVSFRMNETRIVTTMVSTAEKMTVVPEKNSIYSKKKTGISRWLRLDITSPVLGSLSLGRPVRPSLQARRCTWMMILK